MSQCKDALRREAGKAEVVAFRSGLRHTRALGEWLTAAVDHRLLGAGQGACLALRRRLTAVVLAAVWLLVV